MAAPRRPSEASRSIRAAAGPPLQQTTDPGAVPQVRAEVTEVAHTAGERLRPTRITVDLAGDLHSFLRAYAQARDVAAADVIRELIRQVRADPDLSGRVTAELERRREALAEAMRAARE